MGQHRTNKLTPNEQLPNSEQQDEEIAVPYHGLTDRNTGEGEMLEASAERMASGAATTGSDIDANQYQAKVVGEEAVGGTTPTPGQNVTQELEKAVGVEGAQQEPVQVKDTLDRRDDQRWELDPKSAEDYPQRRD